MSTMHGSFPREDFDEEHAHLAKTDPRRAGDGLSQPLSSTFEDAARVIRRMIEVDLSVLPSRCAAPSQRRLSISRFETV